MTTVELTNFYLTLLGTFLLILWMIVKQRYWRYAVGFLFFFLHLAIFYFAVYLEDAGVIVRPYTDFFEHWSSIVRLQLLLTSIYTLLFTMKWKKLWNYLKSLKLLHLFHRS